MFRCVLTAALIAAAPFVAQAQVVRNFPQNALRGQIIVTAPPEITLNGKAAQLSPGSRIKGQDNMIVMSGAAVGQKLVVNYTLDQYGLVSDVWILRKEEIAKRWPRTAAEAAQWSFDPVAQTWTKP
jgi:hypothetical protein